MKVIILFSGGIDSTVMLAKALEQGRECIALSFDYGQIHRIELKHAAAIAKHYGVPQKMLTIDPSFFSSSALVSDLEIPTNRTTEEISNSGTPSTYVPARNTIFLSFATALAEVHGAQEIHIGANLLDQNAYPDCRPEFYQSFQKVINTATQQSDTGTAPNLLTPLIQWDKKQIIEEGRRIQAPLEMTFSCYHPENGKTPCGSCDACILRSEALSHPHFKLT